MNFLIPNVIDLSRLDDSIDFFLENKSKPSDILNSHDSYVKMFYIEFSFSSLPVPDLANLIAKKKGIIDKLYEILEYLCLIKNKIDFTNCKKEQNNKCLDNTSVNDRQVYFIFYLNNIFGKMFLFSVESRRCFTYTNSNNTSKPYLSVFIDFINDEEFISKCMNFDKKFDGFINTIQNLSLDGEESKEVWKSLNSVVVLLNFATAHPKWSVESYATIAVIAFDTDIEKINEINVIIDKFVDLTMACIYNKSGGYSQQLKDEDGIELTFMIPSISLNNGFYLGLDSLLKSLYGLAVNQKARLNIYKKPLFIQSIKKIIYDFIDVFKYYAIKLLSQLAFNNEINDLLNKEVELIKSIEKLKTKSNFDFKKLKKACIDFLWILSHNNKPKEESVEKKPSDNKDSHIMISYNTGSRELCLKIKSELEKLNYKVWIDVNEIHGSSLDSMAEAVENSMCVLMCVTEKYRMSVNCQAEAQYSFRLNKKIIPLIMQQGYQNVTGWLGIIIGDKIFVDFVKYDFSEAMERLVKQIKLNTQVAIKAEPNQMTNSMQLESQALKETVTQNENTKYKEISSNNPKCWSIEQVREWFEKNCINKQIIEALNEVDGSVLFQLYEFKKHMPEYFYKSLTKDNLIDPISISKFCSLLLKLFE